MKKREEETARDRKTKERVCLRETEEVSDP
jgi:hypothetical protein